MSALEVAAVPMKLHIKKIPYSSPYPWRLVADDGREIQLPETFIHPELGHTRITTSVRGNTRKECEEQTLALLAQLLGIAK